MLDEIHIRLTLMDLTLTTLSCLFLLVWPIHYATMQNPRVVMSSATVAALGSIRNRVVTRQQPQRSFQIRPSTLWQGNDLPKRRQTHVRFHPPPSSRQGGRTHLKLLDMGPCSQATCHGMLKLMLRLGLGGIFTHRNMILERKF